MNSNSMIRYRTANLMLACTIAVIPSIAVGHAQAEEMKIPVTFSGGHDLGKNDYGRPCTLMAAALGVKPDEFRKAFSGVTPSRGRGPSGAEARRNKEALMKVLAPLGVTNERMDKVANYYRFRPQNGELWPTKAAQAEAIVQDGKITKIVITDPGSGYCSPPNATVKGFENVRIRRASDNRPTRSREIISNWRNIYFIEGSTLEDHS
jgi:hypothetical protein